jgi:uncharacterized membrane protein YphA (DoxX/SURF4 family)
MSTILSMSTVLWFAQILMAGVFLFAGFSKIFVRRTQSSVQPLSPGFALPGMRPEFASAIALLEIAFAICLVLPVDLLPPYVVPRIAAAGLALLMIFLSVYHARRNETAVPQVVLFLMALLVIVGRWPH